MYKFIFRTNKYNFGSTMSGQLAQSVEQLTENQCVLGSIPRLATTFCNNQATFSNNQKSFQQHHILVHLV